jgi:hypothetical protein
MSMPKRKKKESHKADAPTEQTMGTEPSNPAASSAIAETVKAILERTPVYQDLVQPTAKKVGKEIVPAAKQIVGTAVRAVNMALAPLRAMFWGWERIEKIVVPAIAQRFENALDKMVTPKLNVAGPALEGLRFTGEEPALRDMFINLLATSMNKDTATRAHPAFAEIIRQLTPDEALIVQYLAVIKTVPVVLLATKAEGIVLMYEFTQPSLSLVHLDVAVDHKELIPSYIDNIRRLEIVSPANLSNLFSQEEDPRFARLLEDPILQQQRQQLEAAGIEYLPHGGQFGLTTFGSQFCEACVLPDGQRGMEGN